ncbi:MAG: tRNA 2-thiouridine(34) synthase MnmA [bacterium]
MSRKIAVAFSGGIDSAIAAWILKQSGNSVTGILLDVLDQKRNAEHAKIIADQVEIPLKVLDLHDVFTREIVLPFVQEYAQGRTPNPCIICNAKIKCGWLLEWALDNNFHYLATGHYARIGYNAQKKAYLLKKGLDERKDQSYFLYRLTQKQLSHLVFPLGNLEKSTIKKIANSLNLSVCAHKESQEICFLQGSDYQDFFKKYSPAALKPGPVCDKDGNVLGTHRGLAFYTIGQRKGLNLSKKGPHYVVTIDKGENKIIVGSDNDLLKRSLIADSIHFIIAPKSRKETVYAQIRYNQTMKRAVLELLNEKEARVTFEEPMRAIAPGQSVVFYKDTTIIGGGIITRSIPLHNCTPKNP